MTKVMQRRPDRQRRIRTRGAPWPRRRQALQKYKDLRVETTDGRCIKIHANIESRQSAQTALQNGADGVGLFRTEYFFMNRSIAPSEEEQFQEYCAVAQMFSQEVVLRTLDAGADKKISYLDFSQNENPLFGTRGIRVSLANPQLFLTQLRAVLRASAYGKIKVMFPFVSTMEELRSAKACIVRALEMLREKGLPYDENIEIGMMVELPSAVILADSFAREVDFFSIGTNDLQQYAFAAERCCDDEKRSVPVHHPAMLRMIDTVAKAARQAGIEVSICGGAAESEGLLPVWLAMGIQKISVGSARLLERKRQIETFNLSGCQSWLDNVLSCSCADDVQHILDEVFGN